MLVLGLAALPLIGCKTKRGSDAPGVDVRNWTLAEIEAELERNDHVLADEGIMIAMASSTASPVDPAPSPSTEAPKPEIEAQSKVYDDDGGEAEPPRPEPTSAEPGVGYEAEAAPDRSERRSAARADNRETSSRCERVCELAAATCELETQICELAERHPDEPRYTRACQRAEQQCLAASQACQRCED